MYFGFRKSYKKSLGEGHVLLSELPHNRHMQGRPNRQFTMKLFAHRGMHRHHTENTEAAFDEALRLGFQALELDLVRLKYGHIVLFHDDTLFRMFHIDERVVDLTLPEFQRILPNLMTFDRFCEKYKSAQITVNFEIKDDAETLHRVLPALKEFTDPVISSFNWSIVDDALFLGLKAGYLFLELNQPEASLFSFQSRRLHLPYNGETYTELSESLESFRDFELYFYTVNKRAHLNTLKELTNFHGIFTDEPSLRRAPLLSA